MSDVDVLLPFHRLDRFLVDAIESIRSQQHVNPRLILIDDRADQNNAGIQRGLLRPGDVLLSTGGGRGYGVALQVGSQAISAPHMALMNSDDISLPHRLAAQLKLLESNDVAVARMVAVDSRLRRIPSVAGECSFAPYDPMLLLFGSYGADASWCCRSAWWTANAFFDAAPALDWRIGLASLLDARMAAVSDISYLYRKHTHQITRTPEAVAFRTLYGNWSSFNARLGLPSLGFAAAQAIASPWERATQPLLPSEIEGWLEGVAARAIERGVAPDVHRLLARRMSVRALRSPDSARSRLAWLGRAGWDVPRFMWSAAVVLAARAVGRRLNRSAE